MKKVLFLWGAVCAIATSPAFADSNASGGTILNSETVSLGAGPFNHGAGIGSVDNTIVNANFTGGFSATHVRFQGSFIEILGATLGSEADIQIRGPIPSLNSFNWQNPTTGTNTTTQTPYNSSQLMTGALAGVDPSGLWQIEFFESFNDGAGADGQSSNVSMTFERVDPRLDSNGVFSAGTLVSGNPYTTVGEFAVSQPAGANGNNDRYTFTLTSDGVLDVFTDNTAGFTGLTNGDTEIGIFDAAGNIVPNAFDDDTGVGNYSSLSAIALSAGTYTLVVGDFDTNFSNTSTLSNLTFGSAPTAGYDYGLTMSFISNVPEPSTLSALGLLGLGMLFRRRRN